jgi:hypothetical protein
MYHCGTATTAACGASALPYTGLGLGWTMLAGFALFACGLALRRMFPRREG